MKKKTIANLVMVVVIVAIAIAGLLGVGHIKGWFDTASDDTALLTECRGIITLERDGVAYTTTEDTVLRSGDVIDCETDATVQITVGEGYFTLGEGARVKIIEPQTKQFSMEVGGGEAFINASSPVLLKFDGKQIEIADAVAALSVRKGAQSISVYYGSLAEAQAGQMLEWLGDEKSVKDFSINVLNAFHIDQLRHANENKSLVFSNEDLDKLEAERLAQAQQSSQTEQETVTSEGGDSSEQDTEDDAKVEEHKTEVSKTETQSEELQEAPAKPEQHEPKLTCTITIRCDTILNNWDELDTAKAGYVPADGCILPTVTVEFVKGETVFDVLSRVCKQYGIQIEYSWTPMYDSYYIEGIHHLYEFDCGVESGWMYKVNGWFPNYGCSSYKLNGGDTIVWCYTCKGLGEDVGAERW